VVEAVEVRLIATIGGITLEIQAIFRMVFE
jgi:hypothetical protein